MEKIKNRKIVFLLVIMLSGMFTVQSQNVGIGTNTPNPHAILDIRSTSKGVVFPALTLAQRDAIVNPPDGLHIFNKEERCLNYYDSLYRLWNCYCETDTCKVILVRITANTSFVDFNNAFAINYPQARRFALLIEDGVIVSGGITFYNLPPGIFKIRIINRGGIYGQGGPGGAGATGQIGGPCNAPAQNGGPGGNAITTKVGVLLTIENYGIIAGGGGGGGGGGRTTVGQFGGGGGGGIANGSGGIGGGNTFSAIGCGTLTSIAQNGTTGTTSGGGPGGAGANGGSNGGTGGGPAQSGQNGLGTSPGIGGAPGKALVCTFGPSGTIINNYGIGQVIGVVE